MLDGSNSATRLGYHRASMKLRAYPHREDSVVSSPLDMRMATRLGSFAVSAIVSIVLK